MSVGGCILLLFQNCLCCLGVWDMVFNVSRSLRCCGVALCVCCRTWLNLVHCRLVAAANARGHSFRFHFSAFGIFICDQCVSQLLSADSHSSVCGWFGEMF